LKGLLTQLPGLILAIDPVWYAHAEEQIALASPEAIERAHAAFAARGSSEEDDPGYERVGQGATIKIAGPLSKESSWWSYFFGGCSTVELCAAFMRADKELPSGAAIWAVFDTPGGSVDGIADLHHVISQVGKRRPVYAYVDGMCCSAGYYLASCCAAILGSQVCMVGSIGCMGTSRDSSAMYKSAGIKVEVHGTASQKGAGTPGTVITDAHKEEFQRNVDSTFEQGFKAAVKQGRGFTDKQLAAVIDAKVQIGTEAVALGLIDGIMSMPEVMQVIQTGKSVARQGKENKRMKLRAALAASYAAFKAAGGEDSPEDGPLVATITGVPALPPPPAAATPDPRIDQLTGQIGALTQLIMTQAEMSAQEIAALKQQNAAVQATARDESLRQRVLNCVAVKRNMTSAKGQEFCELVTAGHARYNPGALEAVLPTLESMPPLPRLQGAADRPRVLGPTQIETPAAGDTGEQLVAIAQELEKKGLTAEQALIMAAKQNPALAQSHHEAIPSLASAKEGE